MSIQTNQLQIFDFKGAHVRVVELGGQPWFVLKDVCDSLELAHRVVRQRLTDDVCSTYPIPDSLGRPQETTIINEDGLYDVILESRKPEARAFRKWITSEVLPAIRQHGGYLTPAKIEEALLNPDTIIELAQRLKQANEEKLKLQTENLVLTQQNLELKPKASYYDLVLQNKSLLSITKIAKDYGMSGMALNKKLHELGVQYKQGDIWLLYAKYQDKGYTQTTTHVIDAEKSRVSTKWTQKGRLFIYDLLKREGILPMIERELEKV